MVRLHPETVEKDQQKSTRPLKVHIEQLSEGGVEFDIIGIDPSISNSIRRTIHADIPTLAIETVLVANNTSVIPDEVFAHRLGLVPLFYSGLLESSESISTNNPIILTLKVKNSSRQPVSVYSRELSIRDDSFKDSVKIIDEDILLCRLAANQEVDMELHCIEGTGREHAKWTPVSAAAYRLLPEISILSPITGEQALKFASCFTHGAVIVEKDQAKVVAPRLDMVSRECLRHPEFEDKVILGRVNDHFIFNIEVIGQWPPRQLIDKSLEILMNRCDSLLAAL